MDTKKNIEPKQLYNVPLSDFLHINLVKLYCDNENEFIYWKVEEEMESNRETNEYPYG